MQYGILFLWSTSLVRTLCTLTTKLKHSERRFLQNSLQELLSLQTQRLIRRHPNRSLLLSIRFLLLHCFQLKQPKKSILFWNTSRIKNPWMTSPKMDQSQTNPMLRPQNLLSVQLKSLKSRKHSLLWVWKKLTRSIILSMDHLSRSQEFKRLPKGHQESRSSSQWARKMSTRSSRTHHSM